MSLLGGISSAIGSVFGGSAGGFVGGVADLIGGTISANSANAKSKRAASLAFQRQKQLIDEANEYNRPINQMARLQEAGLNPNLVYENGAQTLSASASAPPQAKVFRNEEKMSIMSNILALRNQELQNRRIEADINNATTAREIQNKNLQLAKDRFEEQKKYMEWQKKLLEAKIEEMRNGGPFDMMRLLFGGISGYMNPSEIPDFGDIGFSNDWIAGAKLGALIKNKLKD